MKLTITIASLLMFTLLFSANTHAQIVTTLAGSTAGFADGTGTSAQFNLPTGVAVSPDGLTVYVADKENHRIRKVSADGKVTTLAGSTRGFADGTGTSAQFNFPYSVAVSPDGLTVYVADVGNHRIRKVSADGTVTTLAGSTRGFADGTGTSAEFSSPNCVSVSPDGSTVYVADYSNHRIRKVSADGKVTTLAGSAEGFADGTGASAQFRFPIGLAVSPDGLTVYVADVGNHRIRKVSADGTVTTLAGSTRGFADGTGTSAEFSSPNCVSVSPDGATVYVADAYNDRIRKVSADGTVTTLAGSTTGFADGTGASAQFSFPTGVSVSPDGTTVYVADSGNDRIRKITLGTTSVETGEQSATAWILSPNPASGTLRITAPETTTETNFTMYDYLGTTVLSGKVEQSRELDISALAMGIYYIRFGATAPMKFIKQ